MTDLEVIQTLLALREDEAFVVLELCHWVDHEVAIARHGYPKDNVIPAPMTERLADLDYVRRLEALAAEDEDVGSAVWDAVVARLESLAQSPSDQ